MLNTDTFDQTFDAVDAIERDYQAEQEVLQDCYQAALKAAESRYRERLLSFLTA